MLKKGTIPLHNPLIRKETFAMANVGGGSTSCPIIINLYDSFGDGWNGAEMTITDEADEVVFSGTIENGAKKSFSLELVSQTYTVTVTPGNWPGEISWEITNIDGEVLAEGGPFDAGDIIVATFDSCGEPLPPPDTNAPTVAGTGDITFTNVTDKSLTVNWEKATDDRTPQHLIRYRLFRSVSDNINTVSEMLNNGTEVGVIAADINSRDDSGLEWGKKYWYNYMAIDESGNKVAGNSNSQIMKVPISEYEVAMETLDPLLTAETTIIEPEAGAGILNISQYDISRVTIDVLNSTFQNIYKKGSWNTFESGQAAIDEEFNSSLLQDTVLRRGYDTDLDEYIKIYAYHNELPITVPPNDNNGGCGSDNNNWTATQDIPALNKYSFDFKNVALPALQLIRDNRLSTGSNSETCIDKSTYSEFNISFVGVLKAGINYLDGYDLTITELKSELITALTYATSNPPTNFEGSSGDGSVLLTWEELLDSVDVGYNIYVDGVKHNSEPIVGSSYLIEGLVNGQSYDFYVVAVDENGIESGPSPTTSVTPQIVTSFAVKFNGIDQYANFGTLANFGLDHLSRNTIEFLVKTTETRIMYAMGASNTGFMSTMEIRLNTDESFNTEAPGKISLSYRATGNSENFAATTNATNINDGLEHRVSIKFEASTSTFQILVDGVPQGVTYRRRESFTQSQEAFQEPWTVGVRRGELSRGNILKANIRDVRIWSDIISDAQIDSTKFNELNSSNWGLDYPNLFRYYKCNDGAGNVVTEEIAGDDGALVGNVNDNMWVPA